MGESKRIRLFHQLLSRTIPKFPNDKGTKKKLEQTSLAQLLIHYLSWASRYIAIKPREVTIERSAFSDPRWSVLREEIESLLEKARNGEDLNPHLSLRAHNKGYTPAASDNGPGIDRWADKDFLLNTMGYHHFHLGTEIETSDFSGRTDEVLFACVTREKFSVMGIFDHSVFDPVRGSMSVERKRLWSVFDEHVTRGASPGTVVLASPIATSGHPIHLVSTAQEYSRVIREIDPKLDNRSFINGLYEKADIEIPRKPKIEWRLSFTDLGIFDKEKNYFFVLRRGFN